MSRCTPAQALDRLQDAAGDGRLAAVCQASRVGLLVAFGSAARGEPDPEDLDLAYAHEDRAGLLASDVDRVPVLALLDDLVDLAGTDRIDLLDLDRAGTVAAARALGRCVPLHESVPGRFAAEQVRASVRFADTRWLRDLQLRALAGS